LCLFSCLPRSLFVAVVAAVAGLSERGKRYNTRIFVVPVERIELPTFGLQNRWMPGRFASNAKARLSAERFAGVNN